MEKRQPKKTQAELSATARATDAGPSEPLGQTKPLSHNPIRSADKCLQSLRKGERPGFGEIEALARARPVELLEFAYAPPPGFHKKPLEPLPDDPGELLDEWLRHYKTFLDLAHEPEGIRETIQTPWPRMRRLTERIIPLLKTADAAASLMQMLDHQFWYEVPGGVFDSAARACEFLVLSYANEANRQEAAVEAPAAKPGKKATVEARMFDLVSKDSSTHTWTIRQFADALECSEGAVHKTKVWKSLSASREMVRQTRSEEAYHKNRDRSPAVKK